MLRVCLVQRDESFEQGGGVVKKVLHLAVAEGIKDVACPQRDDGDVWLFGQDFLGDSIKKLIVEPSVRSHFGHKTKRGILGV